MDCTFEMRFIGQYNLWWQKKSEVNSVPESFNFETFVDVQSGAFEEYLSSVIAKLRDSNPEYRAIGEKIDSLYRQYPKVLAALDTEKPSDLSAEECKALIEILGLKNKLYGMESEAVYFRGCYDSVGYLKKAGIL